MENLFSGILIGSYTYGVAETNSRVLYQKEAVMEGVLSANEADLIGQLKLWARMSASPRPDLMPGPKKTCCPMCGDAVELGPTLWGMCRECENDMIGAIPA